MLLQSRWILVVPALLLLGLLILTADRCSSPHLERADGQGADEGFRPPANESSVSSERVRAGGGVQQPGSETGNVEEKDDPFAGHLLAAPAELQSEAKYIFLLQAADFEQKVRSMQVGAGDWSRVLEELDAKFAQRLRVVAAEHLEKGRGLLVVEGGVDFMKRVGANKFLLSSSGRKLHGRRSDVLVIIDPPDPELERAESSFLDARDVYIAEKLIQFNSGAPNERAEKIRLFLERRKQGKNDSSIFGVSENDLDWIEIDVDQALVKPKSR